MQLGRARLECGRRPPAMQNGGYLRNGAGQFRSPSIEGVRRSRAGRADPGALTRPSVAHKSYTAVCWVKEVTVAASTSFRISDTARTRLTSRAAREGMTATALLDQLIVEGT